MPEGEQPDDKTIPDEAVIWRRVTPDQVKTTDDGFIPTPSAFRDSSDSPMSAILAAGSSTDRALAACPDNGVVGITAGELRALGQRIIRDPVEGEPAHLLVAGRKPRGGFQKKVSKAATWIVYPNGFRD